MREMYNLRKADVIWSVTEIDRITNGPQKILKAIIWVPLMEKMIIVILFNLKLNQIYIYLLLKITKNNTKNHMKNTKKIAEKMMVNFLNSV